MHELQTKCCEKCNERFLGEKREHICGRCRRAHSLDKQQSQGAHIDDAGIALLIQRKLIARGDAFARGTILGVIDVIDCVRNDSSVWAQPDCWHWLLQNPRPLREPMAFRGRQMLFELPEALRRRIEAQIHTSP